MWLIETSAIGRIAIPDDIPAGFALFCTSGDYPGAVVDGDLTGVLERRFGLRTSLTTCNQIHSATVVRAKRESKWRECDACDALWSDEKEVALAIKIADCLPVTLIDPSHDVIANIHSGWRGAVSGIVAETLAALTGSTAFEPGNAQAWLGPSIRGCCFEVGEEVAEQFEPRFVDRSYSKPHVDLAAFTDALLRDAGVERISDSGLCTRCPSSIFHSYRRQGPGSGRNLAVVAQ